MITRRRKKILLVAGARPNFIKISAIVNAFNRLDSQERKKIVRRIVHTGQHYDATMSDVFFKELRLPEPDIYLGVGSGRQGEQTAKIIIEFEKVCIREKPNLIVVVGDVNSTLAASIVAAKSNIPLAHVEAGLRSFDRSMPEEINRLVTDSLSDYLFTTCLDANHNLKQEGIPSGKIYFVGNVMVDTLLRFRRLAVQMDKSRKIIDKYALLTLHRPSNVDLGNRFKVLISALRQVSREIPLIFPAHPRTLKQINTFGLRKYFNFSKEVKFNTINLTKPLSYLRFLNLMSKAVFAITDSGGIQEETTILGVPCLTVRENTERPITISQGTNILVGNEPEKIIKESNAILKGKRKTGLIPRYWDGKAAERIVKILLKKLNF